MRIASYNLLHGLRILDAQPPVAGTYDRGAYQDAVASLEADVLGIQEVDVWQDRTGGDHQVALAAEALAAENWRFAPSVHGTPGDTDTAWRDPTPEHAGDANDPGSRDWMIDGNTEVSRRDRPPLYGVGLISRLPVSHWRTTIFSAAPFSIPLLVPAKPRAKLVRIPDEPRAAIAAVVETASGPLTVVTVHLSFVPGYNVVQLRRLRAWVADLPRPLVLVGDLNLPGRLPAQVTGWRPLLRQATYPVMSPRVQFDHVIADGLAPGSLVANAVVPLPVSDHAAVYVDIRSDVASGGGG